MISLSDIHTVFPDCYFHCMDSMQLTVLMGTLDKVAHKQVVRDHKVVTALLESENGVSVLYTRESKFKDLMALRSLPRAREVA